MTGQPDYENMRNDRFREAMLTEELRDINSRIGTLGTVMKDQLEHQSGILERIADSFENFEEIADALALKLGDSGDTGDS